MDLETTSSPLLSSSLWFVCTLTTSVFLSSSCTHFISLLMVKRRHLKRHWCLRNTKQCFFAKNKTFALSKKQILTKQSSGASWQAARAWIPDYTKAKISKRWFSQLEWENADYITIGSVIRDKRGKDEEEGSEMTDKSDLAARAFWPCQLCPPILVIILATNIIVFLRRRHLLKVALYL